jgi:diguanylate cyclase (GGDEF)-like protein
MSVPGVLLKKSLLENCVNWFIPDLRQRLVSPLEMHFPNYPLPRDVEAVQRRSLQIQETLQKTQGNDIDVAELVQKEWSGDPNIGVLFKQILLRFRRHRATYIEGLLAKTFHPEITRALNQEIDELDATVNGDWFQSIEYRGIPRLKDILPLQLIEESAASLTPLPPRAYDEKFRILYAPTLFQQDLAYFRAKCEARDSPVAIAFLDIDHFKSFNEKYTETLIDRNLLPRLMQTMEAHVYHHGYAYRQGGDEYLILLPSVSKRLAIAFLDELRCKIAELEYPEIKEKTTMSIGLCIAEPDCPLTDRELLERANQAKKEAKQSRNCLATYRGPRLVPDELHVVKSNEG